MTGLIVLLALGPDYQAPRGASGLGLVLGMVYLFSGLSLLIRAHFWAGRADSKTGPSCEGKSLRFPCRHPLSAWRRDALLYAK